jgi:hypothetical protein
MGEIGLGATFEPLVDFHFLVEVGSSSGAVI